MNLKSKLKFPFLLLSKITFNDEGSDTDTKNNHKDDFTEKLVESFSDRDSKKNIDINDFLLRYKEIKQLSNFIGIQPKYILYFFIFILLVIIINYFSKLFTLFIGIIYPLQCSICALKKDNRKEIRKWLEYWIVFFIFLNTETIFGRFMKNIPMYLFYKVYFLCICFLPWYGGAHYIYTSFIKHIFLVNERNVYNFSKRILIY